MKTINARNVNEALQIGVRVMQQEGVELDSRAGKTLEILSPVATTYQAPWERVLLNGKRDANPFFHLMEALWILHGRADVKFLTEFNKRMGEYSDDGKSFNAPYGFRLRTGVASNTDQIQAAIHTLKNDPMSRQVVCQIWDDSDLNKMTKDKACNMSIVFRIRDGKLCMTVYNRSNDMIWGAYGANVVQFSMIQEYVAAHLGLEMGAYTQVSNSFHVYTTGPGGEVWDRLQETNIDPNAYRNITSLVRMDYDDILKIDMDLNRFFYIYDEFGIGELSETRNWQSKYFNELVMPMLCLYLVHKQHGPEVALRYVHTVRAEDWMLASTDWLLNRKAAREAKEQQNENQ